MLHNCCPSLKKQIKIQCKKNNQVTYINYIGYLTIYMPFLIRHLFILAGYVSDTSLYICNRFFWIIAHDFSLWNQNLYFLGPYKHTMSDMISFWQIINEANQNQVEMNKDGKNIEHSKRCHFLCPIIFAHSHFVRIFSLLFLNIYPHIYQMCTYHIFFNL